MLLWFEPLLDEKVQERVVKKRSICRSSINLIHKIGINVSFLDHQFKSAVLLFHVAVGYQVVFLLEIHHVGIAAFFLQEQDHQVLQVPVLVAFIFDAYLQQGFVATGYGVQDYGRTVCIGFELALLEGVFYESLPVDFFEVELGENEFRKVCLHLVNEMQEGVDAHVNDAETKVYVRDVELFQSLFIILFPQLILFLLSQQYVRCKLLQTVLVELVLQSPIVPKRVGNTPDLELNPTIVNESLFNLSFLQHVPKGHPILLGLDGGHDVLQQVLLETTTLHVEVSASTHD